MAATRKGRRIVPLVAAGVSALASGATRADTTLDVRLLFYGEGDDRTQVVNPEMFLSQDLGEKGQLGLLLGYDSISGASPTGEFPTVDATASASSTGQIPMAQYTDTRQAASLSYSRRIGSSLPSIELSHSRESDYLSRGVSLGESIDLFGQRSTLHLGVGGTRDVIDPVNLPGRFDKKGRSYSAGWTQILGPRDLLDVSLGLTKLSGYLTDPYKVVPVGTDTLPEIRPDSRARKTVVLKYGHGFLSRGALKATYRWYGDDWSIRAHTIELVHDQHVGRRLIVTPRLRFYTQNSASFFAWEFAAPQNAMSSDYRLAGFDSWLGGLGMTYQLTDNLSVNVAASYQRQTGTDRLTPRRTAPPALASAVLEEGEEGEGGTRTVSPADLTTITATAGFSFRF